MDIELYLNGTYILETEANTVLQTLSDIIPYVMMSNNTLNALSSDCKHRLKGSGSFLLHFLTQHNLCQSVLFDLVTRLGSIENPVVAPDETSVSSGATTVSLYSVFAQMEAMVFPASEHGPECGLYKCRFCHVTQNIWSDEPLDPVRLYTCPECVFEHSKSCSECKTSTLAYLTNPNPGDPVVCFSCLAQPKPNPEDPVVCFSCLAQPEPKD